MTMMISKLNVATAGHMMVNTHYSNLGYLLFVYREILENKFSQDQHRSCALH